jgi:hypothetical protein
MLIRLSNLLPGVGTGGGIGAMRGIAIAPGGTTACASA